MDEPDRETRFDRHALVLAIWLPAGLIALALFHYGFGAGGRWWVAAGFVPILAGFSAHVVANALVGTGFSPREVALALILFLAAALWLIFATLLADGAANNELLVIAGGMALLAAAVIFYMVTRHGPRGAFEAFDIVRNNNPRRAARLSRRGGRR